jgi:hypothetical protein
VQLGLHQHTLKRILRSLERRKTNELYSLSESSEVLSSGLHLFQAVADRVGLVDDLEDLKEGELQARTWSKRSSAYRIAHRVFGQEVVYSRHGVIRRAYIKMPLWAQNLRGGVGMDVCSRR